MIIYKITNLINNKVYIGQTVQKLYNRWSNHLYVSRTNPNKSHLYLSINKYGKENFKIEIIENCSTKEELNEKEIYWISKYKSNDKFYGYNKCPGGQNNVLSEEGKKKLSEFNKNRWKDSNYRNLVIPKMSHSRKGKSPTNKGKSSSLETRNKISNSRKGKYTKESNHNFNKPGFMLGKKFTEDHKNKIRKKLLGNTNGKNNPNKIKVMCIETGEIFDSVNSAKQKYPGKIYKSIKTGKPTLGRTWVRI